MYTFVLCFCSIETGSTERQFWSRELKSGVYDGFKFGYNWGSMPPRGIIVQNSWTVLFSDHLSHCDEFKYTKLRIPKKKTGGLTLIFDQTGFPVLACFFLSYRWVFNIHFKFISFWCGWWSIWCIVNWWKEILEKYDYSSSKHSYDIVTCVSS